jgi:hypothetical protein
MEVEVEGCVAFMGIIVVLLSSVGLFRVLNRGDLGREVRGELGSCELSTILYGPLSLGCTPNC